MTDLDHRSARSGESSVLPEAFAVAVEPRRDHVRIVPSGELDLATVGQLEQALGELVEAGFERVMIDLRQLTFIDSTGLHALVTAYADAQHDGWELSIVPGSSAVQKLFELTSMTDELPFTVGTSR